MFHEGALSPKTIRTIRCAAWLGIHWGCENEFSVDDSGNTRNIHSHAGSRDLPLGLQLAAEEQREDRVLGTVKRLAAILGTPA
jgi:hypothetical protein